MPCVMEQLTSDLLPDDEARAAAASECFKFFAPDLIPIGVDASPIIVDAGGSVTFPEGGWTLRNQGTADATAENRPLRHGFYLSADNLVDFNDDGDPINGDILLHTESSGGPGTTIPSNTDVTPAFGASTFVIPETVAEGSYNLILYVDDLEEVSELDEVNNKVLVRVPITIEAPNAAADRRRSRASPSPRTPPSAASSRRMTRTATASPTRSSPSRRTVPSLSMTRTPGHSPTPRTPASTVPTASPSRSTTARPTPAPPPRLST